MRPLFAIFVAVCLIETFLSWVILSQAGVHLEMNFALRWVMERWGLTEALVVKQVLQMGLGLVLAWLKAEGGLGLLTALIAILVGAEAIALVLVYP